MHEKWHGLDWVRIPHVAGDPQPKIADGKYRGIRKDDDGTFWGLPNSARRPDAQDAKILGLQLALRNLLDSCDAGPGKAYPFSAPAEAAVDAARAALSSGS